jgi:exopolysaccharide production protein ExoZ
MYKSLQACRGFAALMVVFYHARGVIAQPRYFGESIFGDAFVFGGAAGVDFFFVLSGFIILWIHAADIGQPQRLGAYLTKRAIRIYPTYWIIFAAVYAVAMVVPALRETMPGDAWTLVKSLLLVPQEASFAGSTGAPVLTVAWSLQYEVVFYAFIALAIVSQRAFLAALVLWAFVFLNCRVVCSFPSSFLADFRILLFVLGGVIARLCAFTAPVTAMHTSAATAASGASRASRKTMKLSPWVDRVALAIGMACFVGGATWEALGHTDFNIGGQQVIISGLTVVYGLGSGCIIFGAVKAEDRGAVWFGQSAWQVLGAASYALYLIHYPVVSVVVRLATWLGLRGADGALLAFAVAAGASIALAILFHLRVERPMLRALNAWRWPMPGAVGNPKT